MSDIESDYLECSKCGQQVDQILSLQCDHNLCLSCAAKVVAKWQSFTYGISSQPSAYPPLVCSICSSQTQLDPSAVQILLEMNPSSSCCTEEMDYSQNGLNDSKQSISPQTNITCPQHLTESTLLYCFNCETQCFCMECYLQGLHKNHEVRNISKSFEFIRENANQIQCLLKGCQETLLHEQCKVANKKQELVDLVSQAKTSITANFEELYRTLKLKEQEMNQAADELIADRLVEIENQVAKIKAQIDKANTYQDNLMRHFYESNPQVLQSVEATNYLVKEKKKMQQLIESVKQERVAPTAQSTFCLDTVSIQQMISDIRGVKLSIVSLRGIDTNNPTQREKYLFQKAVEQRNYQTLQPIYDEPPLQKENTSMSFIERSSQKKSRESTNRDFYNKFNEAKKQILSRGSFI